MPIDLGQIGAIDENLSGVGFQQTQDRLQGGAFAGPIGSGERGDRTGPERFGQAVRGGTVATAHRQAAEVDPDVLTGDVVRSIRPARMRLEQVQRGIGGGLAVLGGMELHSDPAQRPEDLWGQQQRGQRRHQCHIAEHQAQPHIDRHQRHPQGGDEFQHRRRQERDAQRLHRRAPVRGGQGGDPVGWSAGAAEGTQGGYAGDQIQ